MTIRKIKKRGPVVARKVTYNGVTFASGLEKYMYKSLLDAHIDFDYEGKTFELVPCFEFDQDCYERQSNGKGEFTNRGNKKVLNLKYTPDFIGEDFIIETKGRANESFPLRWKLFKKWLTDKNDKRTLYKPQNQTECSQTIKLILEKRKDLPEKSTLKDKLINGLNGLLK
jgi:hypothetical protein